MTERLECFFKEEGIEYYAVLDYAALRETKPHLIKKVGITPRSCIIFLIPYFSGIPDNFSAYAASRDYHLYVEEMTSRLIAILKEEYSGASFVGFGDHSPIDERHAAASADLGMLGDNGLIINEKYGSYVFLAEVISDARPDELGAKAPIAVKKCRGCGACRAACPTGILSGEGSACLSAITQRKGALSDEEAALLKKCNTVWGCDACQAACPYNKKAEFTPIKFFLEERIGRLSSDIILSMSDEEFSRRAFSWRGREVLLRNLAIAEGSANE